ncbi:MAG: IS607 family transposase, partial [Bacteroidetes bacterium HGW-Bacteroidetes-22]
MNEYLTLAETSKLIGKSKETLRRWDREGKLS